MKLRNKKTGEAVYVDFQIPLCNGDEILGSYSVTSLKELNKSFEDYNPKEPLIKDEKIRKAVRAWAEANGIGGCICKEEIHCITFETERGMFISFEDADPIPPEGNYTINELCGEDEE